MNLTNAIFRNSVFYFSLIPVFAVWGFWVTYFTRPSETLAPYDHIHGAAMFGWCLMLIVQSLLIRTNKRSMHRQFGKLAYLLGPLIVVSTIALTNYRLNVRGLTDEGLYIFALQVFILLQFIVTFTLAIKNRNRPDMHARYMVCTSFTLLDPIFARLLSVNFIPVEFTTGIIQLVTYGFIDLLFILLVIWDWKSRQRRDVFLPMLIFFAITQLPTFFVLSSPAWKAFADWFMKLPLS
jgi:hypothetical protein